MRTPEGDVKAQIRKYLDSIGAYHFWPVQSGYGRKTVDCLACIHGAFVAIEVKRADKSAEPTTLQKQVLMAVSNAEGWSLCTNDVAEVIILVGAIKCHQGIVKKTKPKSETSSATARTCPP